jgi:hemolysin III
MKVYSPIEEKINIGSHAAGLLLSIVAVVLLVMRASHYGDAWHIVSVSIFGASLIALYAASTAYHSATRPEKRARLDRKSVV